MIRFFVTASIPYCPNVSWRHFSKLVVYSVKVPMCLKEPPHSLVQSKALEVWVEKKVIHTFSQNCATYLIFLYCKIISNTPLHCRFLQPARLKLKKILSLPMKRSQKIAVWDKCVWKHAPLFFDLDFWDL